MNGQSQILSHDIVSLDSINTGLLQIKGKLLQGTVVVQVGTVVQASGPGKDGGDRVSGCGIALYTNKHKY